jgi:hypothetical protein
MTEDDPIFMEDDPKMAEDNLYMNGTYVSFDFLAWYPWVNLTL